MHDDSLIDVTDQGFARTDIGYDSVLTKGDSSLGGTFLSYVNRPSNNALRPGTDASDPFNYGKRETNPIVMQISNKGERSPSNFA